MDEKITRWSAGALAIMAKKAIGCNKKKTGMKQA
jgi:hypothetical protein